MSQLLVKNTLLGLEEIQRAAFLVLYRGLNAAITNVQGYMVTLDQDFAEQTGTEYEEQVLETVDPDDFHEGHIPSLISAPVDRYPNCAVQVSRITPNASSAGLDQLNSYNNSLAIEVMVKSLASEHEVNVRLRRTVEATHIAIMQDSTLGGKIVGLEGPTVILGDVFSRKETTAYGAYWFWQGARIEYVAGKQAPYPSVDQPIFRDYDQN